jgi:4-amino-4-deoxy-L-arabinose transferase-like glycosyltransferase
MVLAVLVALGHGVWALTATVEKSVTADEIAYVTAGHAYNQRGDFRLQPENGNLAQRWVALPLALDNPPLPPAELASWRGADVWKYGHAFFYEQSGSSGEWLFAGRVMTALFSAATGLLVFFWSRSLFGGRGAWLSLALYVLCPAFLAHGALATSDVIMTFFLLASVGAWWRHLEKPGVASAAVSVACFGLAWVAKFSAILLLPMLVLIGAAWAIGAARSGSWRTPLLRLLRTGVVHVIGAWLIIWIFYHGRFSPFAPGLEAGARYYHGWSFLLSDLGALGGPLVAAQAWHLLPDAFLYGFTFVYQFAQQRAAFLNGEYSFFGWPTFFPYAFLVKSTPAFLLLVIAAVVAGVQRLTSSPAADRWTRWRALVPLVVLFVVYWATSVTSHLNIGHRHILPTYPVLFILAGSLGRWLDRRQPLALGFVAAMLVWHAVESARIRPHYLAYFNFAAGGPANGWRHLVDSSLDWGQDLTGVRSWLERHARAEKAYLSYFGTGDPAYEGIRATMLPMVPEPTTPRRWHALESGVYVISATMLQQVFTDYRGDWTTAREVEFQKLLPLLPQLLAYDQDPARRAELLRDAPAENWQTAWKRYEALRFSRLCYYLRTRRPDDHVGYSMLVYRLDAETIRTATAGSLRDLVSLIERSAAAR